MTMSTTGRPNSTTWVGMRETLQELIGEQVVHTLGSPVDLLWVHVRPLWKDHYRVNVFVGKDATSARVANSYFVVVDDNGHIVTSSPRIAGSIRLPSSVDEGPAECSVAPRTGGVSGAETCREVAKTRRSPARTGGTSGATCLPIRPVAQSYSVI